MLLTALLLHHDFGEHAELALLNLAVGHVEVEALRNQQLVGRCLILPAAQHLLQRPQSLYLKAGNGIQRHFLSYLLKSSSQPNGGQHI